MDVEQLERQVAEQDRGRWLMPRDPVTGEPCDFRLKIAGPDSRIARAARLEVASRRLKGSRPTAEDLERESIALLARSVLDIEGLKRNGEPMLATIDAVEWLLGTVPWLREQVDAFSASRAPFWGAA